MARGSLLIQRKGNQWPSSCGCPVSVVCPAKHPPRLPRLSISKKKSRGGGCSRPEPPTRSPPPSEERLQARNSDSKNHKHLTFPPSASALKILTSPPLSGSQGAMQIRAPPFFFFFSPLPHASLKSPPTPPHCSDYLFSISCRLHDIASPSLLLFPLSPGLVGGREK